MATTFVISPPERRVERKIQNSSLLTRFAHVSMMTVVALFVAGYHPFTEDGGLYMAGVEKVLEPSLFPFGSEFVSGHLPFSIFVPGLAALVRVSHVPLETVLFLLHVATIWATLWAGWLIASRCFRRSEERYGAVALLAAWLTLPVAGTSLVLMDPYVTARSVTTPCTLLAIAGALQMWGATERRERRMGLLLCLAALVTACSMHLLMALYGLGATAFVMCELAENRVVRRWGPWALAVCVVGAAAVLQAHSPHEGATYLKSVQTRDYWFPSHWQWYELVGLVAPMVLLAGLGWMRRSSGDGARSALCRAAVAAGGTAVATAVLFSRASGEIHKVASLQPLRMFQVVYLVMVLMLGGAVGGWLLRRSRTSAVVVWLILCGIMYYSQRQIFPASEHLELPGRSSSNQWVQAFEWIREKTPTDARFAMDAHYIDLPGEDAQTFRAIAERSVLPDFSKDGGEASISPGLAAAWQRGVEAQLGMSGQTDETRLRNLLPLGVQWVVLRNQDATSFACDYRNSAVKVCELSADGGTRAASR